MKLLPIVERELRVASRQRATYRVRLGMAFMGLLVGGWLLLLPSFGSPTILGRNLFMTLAMFAMLYSLLAGVRTTADSLSEEKREGTLGLLFLTDLRGYDVVFGKLAATSLNAIYGLLAMFPVMAIPLLLGGVTLAQFLKVMLCALNNLFFSLAVGMFASALCRDERKAMGTALGLILLFIVGLPLLGGLASNMVRRGTMTEEVQIALFFVPSPSFASLGAIQPVLPGRWGSSVSFYLSVGVVHLMGWLFLMRACVLVPRSWQDRPATPEQARWQACWEDFEKGEPGTRRAWRQRLLSVNPIFWLTSRHRLRPVWIWVVLGVLGLIWLWGFVEFEENWLDEANYVLTAMTLHTLLKVWMASEASRQMAQDRRSGALELILATPLTVRGVLRGQWLSLGRSFLGPALLVVFLDVLFLLTNVQDKEWTLLWLAGMTVFLVDMVALGWAAMWFGLYHANANRGSGSAIFYVMVLPWLLFAGAMTVIELSSVLKSYLRIVPWNRDWLPGGIWWVISLAVDGILIFTTRRILLGRFRHWAALRPGKKGRGGEEKGDG